MRSTFEPPGFRRLSIVTVLLAVLLTIGIGAQPVIAGQAAVDDPHEARQTNDPPVASFEYSPSEPEPGEAIVLNGSGSFDPDGEIAEYRWDFDDDGQVDATGGPNRRLAFPRAGEYPVTLTVVDDDGATNSTTRTVVVVGDQPPTASLTASATEVQVAETITFETTGSSDPDGQIVEWALDIDGDGTFEEVFDSPTDLQTGYEEAGTYQVTLRVTDNDGLTDTATVEVVVQPAESQQTDPPSAASPEPQTATDTETPDTGNGGFFADPPIGKFLGILGIIIGLVAVVGAIYYWYSNRRRYPGERL